MKSLRSDKLYGVTKGGFCAANTKFVPFTMGSSPKTKPPGTMHEPVLFPVALKGTLVAFN